MKIIINGETFEHDPQRVMLSDALAIEKAWHRRYAEFEGELGAGSAEAAGVLVWWIWRREGRDVPLDDILSGEIAVDFGEMLRSLATAAAEAQAAEVPTSGAVQPRTGQDGTATTSASTSAHSRRSSGSVPGKSGS